MDRLILWALLVPEVPWGSNLGKVNRDEGNAKFLSNLNDDLFNCMPTSHCKPQKIMPYIVISMIQLMEHNGNKNHTHLQKHSL